MKEITLKEMMEAGLHFGHQTRRWNPKMQKYIFGARNGIYIVDLEKTIDLFKRAQKFFRDIAAKGGTVLFIGTKSQGSTIIEEEAKRCNMPYVNERWLGGMLTNFETIKTSVGRLRELDGMQKDGSFKVLAKKEAIRLQKEMDKLERYLGGIKDMKDLPQAIFVVDTKKERIALAEAFKLGIPVAAIVDTNCDPDGIEFVIPGNDDAAKAIKLITFAIADAIKDGCLESEMRKKTLAEEKIRVTEAKREKDAVKKKEEAEKNEKPTDKGARPNSGVEEKAKPVEEISPGHEK
ncbi:MAG TPA: 30S ribosomal protein S2 [Nitrospinota bacterium]|nr:30S ribosomal protein S2 [Nitrospinota bacterium]